MPEDARSESSEVACDSRKESEFDVPSNDHSDDHSVPEKERKKTSWTCHPGCDKALDKFLDNLLFFVERSLMHLNVSAPRCPGHGVIQE
jgi:hypothetical protein